MIACTESINVDIVPARSRREVAAVALCVCLYRREGVGGKEGRREEERERERESAREGEREGEREREIHGHRHGHRHRHIHRLRHRKTFRWTDGRTDGETDNKGENFKNTGSFIIIDMSLTTYITPARSFPFDTVISAILSGSGQAGNQAVLQARSQLPPTPPRI